jgi:hypothetical protein
MWRLVGKEPGKYIESARGWCLDCGDYCPHYYDVLLPIAARLNTPAHNDMVTHMKTTIEITDALLVEAKRVAAREGITVRMLVEQGLRQAIRERRQRGSFRLRKATFRGEGFQPGVAERGWEHVRELAYEGRGG